MIVWAIDSVREIRIRLNRNIRPFALILMIPEIAIATHNPTRLITVLSNPNEIILKGNVITLKKGKTNQLIAVKINKNINIENQSLVIVIESLY